MLNVKVNEMNGKEVVMSLRRRDLKEDRWLGLTLVVADEIQWDHDMAFCKLEDYRSNAAFSEDDDSKIFYGFSEDEIWEKLFECSGTTDWDQLHMMFKNARWCNHENLMLFELTNGEKFCALKL